MGIEPNFENLGKNRQSSQIQKSAKIRRKKNPKKRWKNEEKVSEWDYEMEIWNCNNNPETRKIRLKKTVKKNENNRHETKNRSKSSQRKLSFPRPPNREKLLSNLRKSTQRNKKRFQNDNFSQKSPFLENRSQSRSNAQTNSEQTNFPELDSDFFSKVEMMSRQSAPQNFAYDMRTKPNKSSFASLADPNPAKEHFNDVNILISFGDALNKQNEFPEKDFFEEKKMRSPRKRKFKKKKDKSYFSRASERWKWTNTFSVSTKKSGERELSIASEKKRKTKKSKSQRKRTRTKSSLKNEQLRLRAALKSIKF